MDNLKKVTKEIVKITNDGTNDYDIYDDVLKVLKREFTIESKKKNRVTKNG